MSQIRIIFVFLLHVSNSLASASQTPIQSKKIFQEPKKNFDLKERSVHLMQASAYAIGGAGAVISGILIPMYAVCSVGLDLLFDTHANNFIPRDANARIPMCLCLSLCCVAAGCYLCCNVGCHYCHKASHSLKKGIALNIAMKRD